MEILRTPDDRFATLRDWPYEPRYTEVPMDPQDESAGSLRIHHVDAGAATTGETILCLHGEPSWGYLYRKMIPVFTAAGHRVVVPDLVGFGRSDKPTSTSDYTYERHVFWMTRWLDLNDLTGLTLVCQDWGGLIGLRLATARPERFARIVVANTGLPTGDPPPNEAFLAWRKFSQTVKEFAVAKIIEGGCASKPLSPEVLAAYDAPFPDDRYKAGARIFPSLVPASLDDPSSAANLAAWDVLRRWDKPFICAFSDQDPISRNGEWVFRKTVPGAAASPHTTIEGGGHFLQEDRGVELATFINEAVAH
ncbi:MAG: haloalkane dehalogenase [Ilumatobacteraceae bacterium]